MATLVLQAAGGAVGGLFGPVGAMIGSAAGKLGGSLIDERLFGGKPVQGPRLTALHGVASTEGAAIPRVYGRGRVGGQMIWATRFEETARTSRTGSSGGKGIGGVAGSATNPKQTTYTYFANVAIALCEGRIAGIRRIWADGREIDQTLYTMRIYHGDETQMPDPLIVAKEGADVVCAYRGLAYVVFERLPLADFGNRVPQLSFEVLRPVDGLGTMIQAIDLIPGASEYAYAPTAFTRSLGPGTSS